MKIYLCIPFFLVLLACSPVKNNNETQDSLNNDTVAQVQKIPLSPGPMLIVTKAAGSFGIGQNFSELDSTRFTIVKTSVEHSTEEGPEIIPVRMVMQGNDTLCILQAYFNLDKVQYEDKVGEMLLNSELFETKDKIHPGSSLKDFFTVYPDAKLFFTYVSGMYWAEAPSLPQVQFLLSGKDFDSDRTDMTQQDMVELKLSEFAADATIQAVRLY